MYILRAGFIGCTLIGAIACFNGEAPLSPANPVPPVSSADAGHPGAPEDSDVPPSSHGEVDASVRPDVPPAPAKPHGIGDGENRGKGPTNAASTPAVSSGSPAPMAPAPATPSAGAPPSDGFAAPASGASSGPASGASPGMAGPSSERPSDSGDDSAPREPAPTQSGVLTAGTWDDNRNFDRFSDYRGELADRQLPGLLATTDEEHESAHEAFSSVHGARQTLDVALVIDTTGSMGDEISYLQTEFLALSRAIEEKFPSSAQRWSLVVYRDEGDAYVTRWFDFREDADEFREKLAAQSADGGGDMPEAPDAALKVMNELAWRRDEVTARLAFWVADAPHHEQNAGAMLSAVRKARELDIHVYPVASSGIDELTELTMRSTAQLTGGRYIFLTDDSGVGNAHKEPSIPCYLVTRLDQAILRMVEIEVSGMYREPATADILRTGGNPEDGACTLASGEVLEVF